MPVIRERRPSFLQNDDRQQLRLARIGIARKQQKRRSARPDTILKQSPSVLNLSGNRSHASSSFILNSSRLSHSISTTQKQPGSFSKPSSVYDRIANGFRKPGNEIVRLSTRTVSNPRSSLHRNGSTNLGLAIISP